MDENSFVCWHWDHTNIKNGIDISVELFCNKTKIFHAAIMAAYQELEVMKRECGLV